MNKAIHFLIIVSACTALSFSCGCGITTPRPRLGCYPTSTPGSSFVSSDKLGPHSYFYSPFERNGITYAYKAGHIDITHLRIAADHTKYLSGKLYIALLKGQKEFSFSLTADRSKHTIQIHYPKNWNLSKDKLAAKEVSLQLAQYLTFSATTWHEMLTWYGYKTMGIFSETASAFSWEDIYSNLLGIRIGTQALRDTKHSYNKAVTLALQQELKALDGQSARTAIKAAEKVRGQWFDGNLIVSMKKRNLDIGLDDGYITPMIVPGVCSWARPKPYPVPNSDVSRFGFSIEYSITPREFEKNRLLRVAYPNGDGKVIKPNIHFPMVMANIRKTAIQKYGREVATAYDPGKIAEKKTIQIATESNVNTNAVITSKNKIQTPIEDSLQTLLTML